MSDEKTDGRGKWVRKPKVYSIEGLPIDDAATKEKFGYAATEVSPTSRKLVSCRCVRCARLFVRQRGRITPSSTCRSCSHTKTEGTRSHTYLPDDGKTDCVCVTCGRSFKRRQILTDENLQCRSCIRKTCWGTSSPGIYPVEGSPIDDQVTQERFGYTATSVSFASSKKVSCRCTKCGALFDRRRAAVTPVAVCASCAHTYDNGPATFPHQTGYEKVDLVCPDCGKSFKRYRKTVRPDSKCDSCVRKVGRWSGYSEHPYILDAETQERFGYSIARVRARSHTKVVVRCARCDGVFERVRRAVTETPVCVSCAHKLRPGDVQKRKETMLQRYGVVGWPLSKQELGQAERAVGERLEGLIGRILTKQRVLPSGQRIDFYDTKSGVGIEYNGLHWHHETSPTPRERFYHREKQLISATVGIDLITVFEDEWRDRQYQVENVIMARMGVYERRVGARQCTVRQITVPEANVLLEREHIQGNAKLSRWAWGLELASGSGVELLGVLTLAPHHRGGHAESIVLNRLCFARGVQVMGGASRLLKGALNSLQGKGYKKLLSWSDNRWSKGTVYERLGFVCAEELPPDYTYVVVAKPRERISKQSQMKSHTGCPAGMTELEWAHQNGLARVWDCGKKRWEMLLRNEVGEEEDS